VNEQGYPLTIEILKDNPCGAILKKGDIHKARIDPGGGLLVYSGKPIPWRIFDNQAQVVK
jgi:hypothetical protein